MDLIKQEPLLRKKRSHRRRDLYFEGKTLFCTYKNCPISPKDVIKFFQTKKIEYCVIGREYQNASRSYDLLVYIYFSYSINTTNQSEFDFIDDFGKIYHPFFIIILSKKDMILFITKKGHYYQFNFNVKKYLETTETKDSYTLYNLIEAKIGEIEVVTDKKETHFTIEESKKQRKVTKPKKENKDIQKVTRRKKEENVSKDITTEIKTEAFRDITIKIEDRII